MGEKWININNNKKIYNLIKYSKEKKQNIIISCCLVFQMTKFIKKFTLSYKFVFIYKRII